jgi:hypothetical protein
MARDTYNQERNMPTFQCIADPMIPMPQDITDIGYQSFAYTIDADSKDEAWIIISARYLSENPHRTSLWRDCTVSMKRLNS